MQKFSIERLSLLHCNIVNMSICVIFFIVINLIKNELNSFDFFAIIYLLKKRLVE